MIGALVALSVASGVFGFLSSQNKAESESDRLREQARLKELQSKELLRKQVQDTALVRKRGAEHFAQEELAVSLGGIDTSSGSSLVDLANIQASIEEEEFRIRDDYLYKSNTASGEARSLNQSASDLVSPTANLFRALNAGVQTATTYFDPLTSEEE